MEVTSVILAAGNGTRMKSETPKVLHKICMQLILEYVLKTSHSLSQQTIVVVNEVLIKHQSFLNLKKKHNFQEVVQYNPEGTADAVKCALNEIKSEYTLVLYGDVPFIELATLEKMKAHIRNGHDLALLGFEFEEENQYGKILLDSNGIPCSIVEHKESQTLDNKKMLCNAGIMMVRTSILENFLKEIKNDNNSKEYYLTDLVNFAYEHKNKYKICLVIADEYEEVIGINDKSQLAFAEKILQKKLRSKLLESGVTILDPETVFLNPSVSIAPDVTIHPYVFFGPDVTIEPGSVILPFSHIEGVTIHKNCTIGPFARIRPNTVIGNNSKIGNFVEVKNANISSNTKASHLSYIGDASIGENTNIGAGTVFCNYDGNKKHRSQVGQNSFIGSNTSIIAPIEIGDNVIIGAGSVINQNVPSDNIGISRSEQKNIKRRSLLNS